jgi:hypothetical protein
MGTTMQACSLMQESPKERVYKEEVTLSAQIIFECRWQPASFSFKQTGVLTFAVMVSAWLIVKTFVAIVPLTHVFAQYGTPPVLPSLLDATADELIAGLEAGDFTSLNLVDVNTEYTLQRRRWLTYSRLT